MFLQSPFFILLQLILVLLVFLLLWGMCCRFDKANKRGARSGYFVWLMTGYGVGGYLAFVFTPLLFF